MTDLGHDYQHGRTIGRRDARQSKAYARRQAERERELAAGEYRQMPTARAWSLGYARGVRSSPDRGRGKTAAAADN